jgi:hypothetical protein
MGTHVCVELESRLETGVTGASPPTVTSMGSSFYLGWLVQGRRPYVIWFSEGLKVQWIKVRDSLHRLLPRRDSQRRSSTDDGTCLRDKTNKTRICAAVG